MKYNALITFFLIYYGTIIFAAQEMPPIPVHLQVCPDCQVPRSYQAKLTGSIFIIVPLNDQDEQDPRNYYCDHCDTHACSILQKLLQDKQDGVYKLTKNGELVSLIQELPIKSIKKNAESK